MNDFIEVPASKMSLAKRKPVFGIGINDASYIIGQGESVCPCYRRWANMLRRCYSVTELKKNPTYSGCSVCDEWLIFSNFKDWMLNQEWEGMDLDKDLLIQGNKVYSPEFCIFVPHSLNSLFLDCGSKKGEWPKGVYFDKARRKFKAKCSVDGMSKELGRFVNVESAIDAYQKFKSAHIKEVAQEYKSNKRLYDALIERSKQHLHPESL